MKLEDAPARGWYPDPGAGLGLRWWEGTDWGDARRALPSDAETLLAERAAAVEESPRVSTGKPNAATREMVDEFRTAAREEANRAADLLSRRMRSGVEQARKLANDYVKLVLRWVRIVLVVGATAIVAWFVLQFIAQITLLEWLGDRIDNVTGD